MGSSFIFSSEEMLEELTKGQIIQLAKTIHEDHHKTENERIVQLEEALRHFAEGYYGVSAFGQKCAQAAGVDRNCFSAPHFLHLPSNQVDPSGEAMSQ